MKTSYHVAHPTSVQVKVGRVTASANVPEGDSGTGDISSPVPRISKVYESSPKTLLAILTVAVYVSPAAGAKAMSNVVVPPGVIGDVGCRVTEKAEPVCVIVTCASPVNSKSAMPGFEMANVCSTASASMAKSPKSVPSSALGSAPPLAIRRSLPDTSMPGPLSGQEAASAVLPYRPRFTRLPFHGGSSEYAELGLPVSIHGDSPARW